MPRIKQRSYGSDEFHKVSRESRELGEHNACAPLSVALATGVPIEQVHQLFYKHGRKHRQGTPTYITRKVLEELGYRMIEVSFKERQEIIERYPGVHKNLHSITTYHPTRFKEAWAGMGTMLMVTYSHICCLKDDVVHDWSSNRALRCHSLYRVIKADEACTVEEPKPL